MSTTLLWRLDGDPQAVAPEKMIAGLLNHLATDDLITVQVQIGAAQQQYVLLPACEGCALGVCALGCRASLLGRVLRASGGEDCQLRPFPLGLHPRPYTRAMLAWPTRHAEMLTSELLEAWPEARLSLHWRQGVLRQHITVAALLLVGVDGPAPDGALRAAGWRSLPLPHLGERLARLLTRPLPLTWPTTLGHSWPGDPWLVAPTRENEPAITEELAWTPPLLSDTALSDPSLSEAAFSVKP